MKYCIYFDKKNEKYRTGMTKEHKSTKLETFNTLKEACTYAMKLQLMHKLYKSNRDFRVIVKE